MPNDKVQEFGRRYPEWGWCWVCEREVRLLEACTMDQLGKLLSNFTSKAMAYHKLRNVPLDAAYDAIADPVVKRHRELAKDGVVDELLGKGWSPNIIAFHVVNHRADFYGPPCWNCGRLLRTPRANYCPECMASRTSGQFEKPMS